MQTPTALTPEPTDNHSSLGSVDSSFGSAASSMEMKDISLTPSPRAIVPHEDTPLKPVYTSRKALQDILVQINNTNSTPKQVITLQETPLRSTPLLTPPSSDERPAPTATSTEHPSSPTAPVKKAQVPLAQKILAQSALYSQAIQKQQQPPLPSSNLPAQPSNVLDLLRGSHVNLVSQQEQHALLPPLTYAQLQQQQKQQFLNRLSSSTSFEEYRVGPSTIFEDASTVDRASLTSIDLPMGDEISNSTQTNYNDQGGSKQIVTIPKPDPLDNPLNTTNVYINGLPLRWTDDDLYRLTRGFGAVKSVKLFTRHLEDKPSAYGFVLFNCVEDAERFIMTLRQHTNFHPSFAKTAKVPGTTNAKHAISDPIIPIPKNEDFADISITGLPLTVDMQTLRALFAPQVIKASKFFHTTGTPRRLVGFIRLESQRAVQDITERLHGSSVLGWTDKLIVKPLGTDGSPAPTGLGISGGETEDVNWDINPRIQMNGLATPSTMPVQRAPTLGVYQHQDVGIDDFARLLGAMSLSNVTGKSVEQAETSPISTHFHKRQDSLNGHPSHPSPRNHSPYTPILELNQLNNFSPMVSSPPQSIYHSNHAPPFGLGISFPNTSTPPTSTSHTDLPHYPKIPDVAKIQQNQLQGVFGNPQETLQALQAAVSIQDSVFADLSSIRRGREGPKSAPKEVPRDHANAPWSTPAENGRAFRGGEEFHMDQTPWKHNVDWSQLTSPVGSLPFGGKITPSSLKTSSGMYIPPNQQVKASILLPALSPTSDHAPSEEPGPATPAFMHVPSGASSQDK